MPVPKGINEQEWNDISKFHQFWENLSPKQQEQILRKRFKESYTGDLGPSKVEHHVEGPKDTVVHRRELLEASPTPTEPKEFYCGGSPCWFTGSVMAGAFIGIFGMVGLVFGVPKCLAALRNYRQAQQQRREEEAQRELDRMFPSDNISLESVTTENSQIPLISESQTHGKYLEL